MTTVNLQKKSQATLSVITESFHSSHCTITYTEKHEVLQEDTSIHLRGKLLAVFECQPVN